PTHAGTEMPPKGYWALKTTSGHDRTEHWPEFLASNVLAIGWEKLKIDPSTVSDAQLRRELIGTFGYSSHEAAKANATIRKFIGLADGDIVVICKGFVPKQDKGVHIYGLARVTGPFRAHAHVTGKWRFKHDAVIQVVGIDLPKEAVSEAVDKGSMR